jgi:hypothetical protein
VGHGLSKAAIALINAIRLPEVPPDGWVTYDQLMDNLGITKDTAYRLIRKYRWRSIRVQPKFGKAQTYFGPK